MDHGPLGPPPNPLLAGLEALVVAALLFAFGYLLVSALDRNKRLDLAERVALAFPGLLAFSLVLMLVHVSTAGWVLGRTDVVVLLTGAAGTGCLYLARREPRHPRAPRELRRAVAGVGALALVVWGLPVFQLLPLFAEGDPGLHAGWTSQLLAGDVLPTATVPGDIPNYYPWLFHSLLGWIAHLTPGGTAYHAYGPLQLLQPAGMALGLFALGRRLFGGLLGGWSAAILGAMSGGIGFVIAKTPNLVMHPIDAGGPDTYLGDLLFVRGPSVGFSNLSPPFPRDVALTVLIGAVLLAVIAAKDRGVSFLWSGLALGTVALTGAESLFVGLPMLALFTFVVSDREFRARNLRNVCLPALGLYALWVVPLIVNYLRLDGFVHTSQNPPVVLELWSFAGALGVTVPFALGGLVLSILRRWARVTTVLLTVAVAVPSLLLLVAEIVPGVVGDGFIALGRPHRYWPLISLGIALFAAAGATRLFSVLPRSLGLSVGALAVGVAVASPVLGTLALRQEVPRFEVLTSALQGNDGTVYEALRSAGAGCTVAGRTSTPSAFGYTGHRFVSYVWRTDRENDARIRWKKSLEQLPSDEERAAANAVIADGRGTQEQWQELVDRYDIDVIVADESAAGSERFDGLEGIPIRGTQGADQVFFQLKPCG